jgi:tetratricopeptide (TPR) repeat protein
MSDRLDRKALRKPDLFQRETRHLGEVLLDRWPLVASLAVLLAVIVAGGLWWQSRTERREAEAAAVVAAAVATFEGAGPNGQPMPDTDPAAAAREALPALRAAAARYQGTEASATAQLYVAHALLETGDGKGAEGAYDGALATAPNDLARDAARLGLGHARLAQGNAEGAVTAWRPLAEGQGPYRALVLLDLARAYEALNRPEDARKAYADGIAALRAGQAGATAGRTLALAEERLAALGGSPTVAASPAAR